MEVGQFQQSNKESQRPNIHYKYTGMVWYSSVYIAPLNSRHTHIYTKHLNSVHCIFWPHYTSRFVLKIVQGQRKNKNRAYELSCIETSQVDKQDNLIGANEGIWGQERMRQRYKVNPDNMVQFPQIPRWYYNLKCYAWGLSQLGITYSGWFVTKYCVANNQASSSIENRLYFKMGEEPRKKYKAFPKSILEEMKALISAETPSKWSSSGWSDGDDNNKWILP